MTETVVIVGSGQAGIQTAVSLRDEGFAGCIQVVGEEAETPYQRPPLSKAYLLGKLDEVGLHLKPQNLYADYRIELIDGVRATRIELADSRLLLANGSPLAFDHLVLATGARERWLEIPGAQLRGVVGLRSLDDARWLKERLTECHRVVVVGAGFIGLEFAAVARDKGIEVAVVEISDRPLARALSGVCSAFFRRFHQDRGVRFHFNTSVTAIRGENSVEQVELADGTILEADIVLMGIGVRPNDELAQAAGLGVGNGITTDESLRTSAKNVFAIGDCASHPNRFSTLGMVRIESVQNANDQARVAAKGIVGGRGAYEAVPWFWSDQGSIKLQIAGLSHGHDRVAVRGDPDSGAFSSFLFAGDHLVAVESLNRGPDHIMARRLIMAGAPITPAQAADESFSLKTVLGPVLSQ